MVAQKEIELCWVPTKEQKANLLTKVLGVKPFQEETEGLLVKVGTGRKSHALKERSEDSAPYGGVLE
jgi:hypothetical protein